MKNTIQTIKRNALIGLTAAITATSMMPTQAEIEAKLKPAGLNELQVGYTSNDTQKTRLITNVSFGNDNVKLKYFGANNKDSTTGSSKGIQSFSLDLNKPISPAIQFYTNNEGLIKTHHGIHTNAHVKALGFDFGWGYIGGNKDEITARTLLGKNITEKLSASIMNATTWNLHGGNTKNYTELEAKYKITNDLSLFGRASMVNFDTNNAEFIGGVTYNIKF